MYCENCGALLTGGGKFCPECGAAVVIKSPNTYKSELETGGQAFAYLPEEEPAFARETQSYAYSDETIQQAQAELDRPSSAEEYKKASADWRDHVDSDRFRQQNAGGQAAGPNHFSDQPFYTQPGPFANRQNQGMYGYETEYSDKNYIVAALLAFFLGGLGIHNFYLGYKSKAIIQLILGLLALLTFGLTGFVSGIWAFVEFILLLTGGISTDGDGRPLKR